MKLAAKFTILLLLGVVTLIAVDGYLAWQREMKFFEQDMRRDAWQLCDGVQEMLVDVWKAGGQQRVLQLIENSNRENRIMRMRWVWLDGFPRDAHRPQATAEQLLLVKRERIISLKHVDPAGTERLLTYARVAIDDGRMGAIELDEPLTHSREMTQLFVRRMVAVTGITFLLGAAMVVLLGIELVGRPLRLLIDKTRRIGTGDLSGPLRIRRRDEFGELATAINSMCEQLINAQHKAHQETTRRIAALEQLRHADRLRTVGRLASGVAHELGTPLNVVGGRASLIAGGKLSEAEAVHSAQIIKSETDRITHIIRQLLDFARRNTPKRSAVELPQLARRTIDLLGPLAEKNGVTIECSAADQPLTCNVDSGQIQQVLTNLLVNAVQAMPSGGKVTVQIHRQPVQPPPLLEASAGEYLLVAVRDQGGGIPPEEREQVFEPFFTTKEVGEGTGLGLSIAYGIIQDHGGWIEVQSEPGQGSCFTVYLPQE
ncbi:MAG: HAMP domain-containing protein [Planctomycetales bacterium]|nr:HAMP domain-containing protein [Planctomycetales bacterium]NIN07653.1 HAMP domain-containing protein [Planctomycetales bacterium]NIN76771.1 HAMP domain-containing protein [Planctomycetales bacterium]NIO33980.1 HAMP domain-containing protein [Planctomycetales bacterium]NIO45764.1 HAMP domain-containing protein [Planctomycetales bacterium]